MQAICTLNIVLLFIDVMELNHTKNVHKEQTINTTNITKALAMFMKIFRLKMPILASEDTFWDRDNALVHTTATVQTNLAAKSI